MKPKTLVFRMAKTVAPAFLYSKSNKVEETMNRVLTCTAVALLLSIAPAFAANSNQSDASKATTPSSGSPATVLPSASPDKSSGALGR